MQRKDSYHFYAMITILFWSWAYVFTRLALQHFTSFALGFLRYFVASATLLVVVFITKMKVPDKKDCPLFLASGAFGFFFYMITFNKASETVSSATGSVIIAMTPIITALLARVLYSEKLKVYQWIAITIEFFGILVLTLMNGIVSVNTGILWMLGAAFFLSGYNLLQRHLTKKYSALQSSTYSIFAGTILLLLFAPTAVTQVKTASPIQFLYIVILGIFSSAIAYVAWSKALSKAEKTTYVSNYMFVTPFLTTLFGFVIAGEIPDTATFFGGVIIMAGLLLFNKETVFRNI